MSTYYSDKIKMNEERIGGKEVKIIILCCRYESC